MPWARASALDRHMACPAASWLPRWDRASWMAPYLGLQGIPSEIGPSKDSSAADWGTASHEGKAGHGVDPWQSAWDPVRDKFYPPSLGVHEQAYSYNCKTGVVELGPTNAPVAEMDAWKQSRSIECVTGTADWDGTLPSGEPWIDDLKTGWKRPDTRSLPMLFYGLCRNSRTMYDSVRLSISHSPRNKVIDIEAQLRRYWLQVSAVSLDLFQDDLQKAYRMTNLKSLPTFPYLGLVRPGAHCGYCPSASICPSQSPEFT